MSYTDRVWGAKGNVLTNRMRTFSLPKGNTLDDMGWRASEGIDDNRVYLPVYEPKEIAPPPKTNMSARAKKMVIPRWAWIAGGVLVLYMASRSYGY